MLSKECVVRTPVHEQGIIKIKLIRILNLELVAQRASCKEDEVAESSDSAREGQ